jgi:hypothetical protein
VSFAGDKLVKMLEKQGHKRPPEPANETGHSNHSKLSPAAALYDVFVSLSTIEIVVVQDGIDDFASLILELTYG